LLLDGTPKNGCKDLRLDWLRAFVAVVETGGFTAAAARLHVSQPALHTQVKQLASGPARSTPSRVAACS
jgi:hypothetical protein